MVHVDNDVVCSGIDQTLCHNLQQWLVAHWHESLWYYIGQGF